MSQQSPPNVDSTSNTNGMSGSLPPKTPVSLLQELCMRRGTSPKYDLMQIEGAVHDPTFVYKVTVGEFTAEGSGQSKKKAKHSAAKAVLDIIIQAAGAGGPASGQSEAPPELSTQIATPYDDDIPGNHVGSLLELCLARMWPSPSYELTSEEGFPHDRTFSIACTVGTIKEIGSGKSKKSAKRQAAYKMVTRLKNAPADQQPAKVVSADNEQRTVDKFYQLKLQDNDTENASSNEKEEIAKSLTKTETVEVDKSSSK